MASSAENGSAATNGEAPRSYRKPFAVATTRGKVASLSTLQRFAIKGDEKNISRVLTPEDAFKQAYGEDKLIEPKYDPQALKDLLDENTYHMRACHTKAQDVGGADWEIVDKNPDDRKERGKRKPPSMREYREKHVHEKLQESAAPGSMTPLGGAPAATGPAGPARPPSVSPSSEASDEPVFDGEEVATPDMAAAAPQGDASRSDEDPVFDGEDDLPQKTAANHNGGTSDPLHPSVVPNPLESDPFAGELDGPSFDSQIPSERNRAMGVPAPEDDHTDEHRKVRERIDAFENPFNETMYLVWLDYESTGRCAFEIVRSNNKPDGEIVDLVHIPSETMRQHISKDKYKQKIGMEEVWYKDVRYQGELDYKSGLPLGDEPTTKRPGQGFLPKGYTKLEEGEEDMRATEVVYMEQPGGVPDIVPAIASVFGDNSRQEYNLQFFENYGVPSMMLLITGDYDPGEEDGEGVTAMEKFIEERLSELIEESWSSLVIAIPTVKSLGDDIDTPNVKIEAVPLGTSVSDASFRMYRSDNRDEILTANQVDPYRAQVIVEGQLGGSSSRESTEIYKQSTLRPKRLMLEHRLNRYVINDQGRANPNSKLEFSQLDNRDVQGDLAVASGMFGMAAMTPNEIIENFRSTFNLGGTVDHPAMDLHYLAGVPLDSDDPVASGADEIASKMEDMLGVPKEKPKNDPKPKHEDPFAGEPGNKEMPTKASDSYTPNGSGAVGAIGPAGQDEVFDDEMGG